MLYDYKAGRALAAASQRAAHRCARSAHPLHDGAALARATPQVPNAYQPPDTMFCTRLEYKPRNDSNYEVRC